MLFDFKNDMLHDSSLAAFREPTGALKPGEMVTIKIRTRLGGVSSVYLSLISHDFRSDYNMTGENGYWTVSISAPSAPGVYWYYFSISVEGKVYYYGTEGGRTSGIGCVYTEKPSGFQMTVYKTDFNTPDWLKKGVMYQIFPDRFKRSNDDTAKNGIRYHESMGRKVVYHKKWDEEPLYMPAAGEKDYNPTDYYGGTLKGIEDSLGFLKELGISVIYLNPIFEAASNHRYNTADYMKVDPILGSNEDLTFLCSKAEKLGIKVILDGVFSHTGSDSIYFNSKKAYDAAGAYNSNESPYYDWYTFKNFPDDYKCWWGFKTLPEVNEINPNWQDYVIKGEDSIIRHWIKSGAKGYRLDVADEIPDDVLEMIYASAKGANKDAAVIGEVWEDATTKHSYGVQRRYALGGLLDSVTNYPLRNAIVGFLTGKIDSGGLKNVMIEQASNYPQPMYYSLMNLLSSHDIERIRTALSVKIDPHELTRTQQASFHVSDSQNKKGAVLQRLAAAIQFSLPGIPCIYYGDEKGMNGFLDPFNRKPYSLGAYDLTDYYKNLAMIRNLAKALSVGKVSFFCPDPDCIGILRFIIGGRDAFGEPAEDGIYLTIINRCGKAKRAVFDFQNNLPIISENDNKVLLKKINGDAYDQLSDNKYTINNALLDMIIQPYSVKILKI